GVGFGVSKAAVVVGGQGLTQVELSFTLDLALYATDPQGLPLYFRVVSAQNGQAALAPDGHTVTFVPSAGYHGPASFQFVADDGFGTSAPATASINVSDAPLVNLDFAKPNPRVQPGRVRTIGMT